MLVSLSLSTRQSSTVIVSRKIVKCDWFTMYGEALDKLDPRLSNVTVKK